MSKLGFVVNQDGIRYPFIVPYGHGPKREARLGIFSDYLKEIGRRTGFKISSRGWCYQLEGYRLMDKGDFNKVTNIINECRKKGYLPIDFVASEKSREFEGISIPDTHDTEDHLKQYLNYAMNCHKYYTPDWWEDEEYYVQVWVEKVDLVTLFKPVCSQYHIPIGNSKGWSSILQRYKILERCEKAENRGLTPVILYCGDHDPYGLLISDQAMKNFRDLYQATLYDPRNVIFDRFGLNEDFINEHGLTWIDNIESASGKVKYDDPVIQDYIYRFGERKCEANALIVNPVAARDLITDSIEHYLGDDAVDRFKDKKQVVVDEIDEHIKSTGLRELPLIKEILDGSS